MNKDARYTALKILLRCAKRTCTLDKSIDDAKNELECMSRQDRNLCNAIVFGVLRNRGYLDFIIRSFSKKSIERLDEPVLYILRIGLFQLVFLDRIPAFATINTSIELAKNQTNIGAQGFINAVLRNAEKNRHTLALPDGDKNGAAHICVQYSMPAWLTKRWITAYGYEKSLSLCKAINTIPPITATIEAAV